MLLLVRVEVAKTNNTNSYILDYTFNKLCSAYLIA